MRLSAALLLGAMACGHAPGKEAVATKPEAPVRFVGTITDLDFGCWADRTCAVRVDDVWVALPGGPQAAQAPHGQLVGIAISGEPGDVLKAKVVGKRAEVFAAPAVAFDAAGKGPVRNKLIGSASRRADLRGAKSTGYCCYLEISQRWRRRWIGAEAVKLFLSGP